MCQGDAHRVFHLETSPRLQISFAVNCGHGAADGKRLRSVAGRRGATSFLQSPRAKSERKCISCFHSMWRLSLRNRSSHLVMNGSVVSTISGIVAPCCSKPMCMDRSRGAVTLLSAITDGFWSTPAPSFLAVRFSHCCSGILRTAMVTAGQPTLRAGALNWQLRQLSFIRPRCKSPGAVQPAGKAQNAAYFAGERRVLFSNALTRAATMASSSACWLRSAYWVRCAHVGNLKSGPPRLMGKTNICLESFRAIISCASCSQFLLAKYLAKKSGMPIALAVRFAKISSSHGALGVIDFPSRSSNAPPCLGYPPFFFSRSSGLSASTDSSFLNTVSKVKPAMNPNAMAKSSSEKLFGELLLSNCAPT